MGRQVSIVIITCGALDYLKFCVEGIQKYTNPTLYKLIVVNNGSKETKRFLDEAGINTIHNEKNLGPVIAAAQGERTAVSKFILLLNDDTMVSPVWLDTLIEVYSKYRDCGLRLLGPLKPSKSFMHPYRTIDSRSILEQTALEKHGTPQDQLFGYCNTTDYESFVRDFKKINNVGDRFLESPPEFLTNYCLFGEVEFFRTIGGIVDFRFKTYGSEDADLSWRVGAAGFKIMRTAQVYVHHFEGVSIRKTPLQQGELLKRNNIIFYRKWRKVFWEIISKKRKMGQSFSEITSSCWFLGKIFKVAIEIATTDEIPKLLVDEFFNYKRLLDNEISYKKV